MKNRKKIAGILCGAMLFSTGVQAKVQNYTATDFLMDTFVTQSIFTEGEDITGAIAQEIQNVETKTLSWTNTESEIALINQHAGDPEGVEVTEEMASYLETVLQLAADSDGAFDPTLGEVIRLWDIDGENPHIPDEADLAEKMKNVNYKDVRIEGNKVYLKEGCTLDLGGIGKGIGSDLSRKIMDKDSDITGALINLGGSSVMSYREKTDHSPWKIGVTDPRNPQGDYLGIVQLEGTEFLSTSGDYQKYFMKDGVRYHHILDPKTGSPVQNGIAAVTVVCNNGAFADGLSTACFVLGPKGAQPLLEKYDADALFITGEHEIYLTEGMQNRFQLVFDEYTILDWPK
ncbi:MAG: FAD:protein FMN transferase [Eubacteriales bacterium]|nr:FAD:protein FMN transferase [Eubacteriales bacterium]